MLKLLRWFLLLAMPAVFWAAWYIVPNILEANGLRVLSGIVTILWGLEFWFFQRLSVLSSLDGLSSREGERLVHRLAAIRRRIWWIGGIGLASSLCIWLLVEMKLPMSSPIYAAMVGVLFGISLSYLILIPGWVGETQDFVDQVRRDEQVAKRRAEAAKTLQDSQKK